jgi:hypothetical protein
VVSRVLRGLVARRIVATTQRRVRILDAPALGRIAG